MRETEYRRHLFTYRFEGAEYGFDIPAKDEAEAKRRLSALGMARYDGVLVATIKVPNAFARLVQWLSLSP